MMRRVLVQVDEVTHAAWKARAFVEGRSMSELARRLIEDAVLEGQGGVTVADGRDAGSSPGASPRPSSSVSAAVHTPVVRAHMKKHRPAVECPTRVVEGVCPDCGQVVG